MRILVIVHLLNEHWKRRKITDKWKRAEIILLFKKEEQNSCKNYRVISLLNTSYKLYARVSTDCLKKIADMLLLDKQSSFRKSRSCNDNVTVICQLIEKQGYNLETPVLI